MVEKLMTNPYAWLFLSICTIVSLVYAIYMGIVGRRIKEISIDSNTNEIVKKGKSPIQKLELYFDGKNIQDLSSTIFYIWNSGSDVINKNDMVGSNAITFISENAQILEAQIVKQSDDSNSFRLIEETETNVRLDFDYIDRGDGVKIQVLHTGVREDISIKCKIKGGKPIRKCEDIRKNQGIKGFFSGLMDELFPLLLFGGCIILSSLLVDSLQISSGYEIVISIIAIIFTFILVIGYIKAKKKIRKVFYRIIPDALKKEE